MQEITPNVNEEKAAAEVHSYIKDIYCIYENHKEGTCVSFNSVLNYWIHYYIDHTNCSRPVYIMALIRRNYYVTKKLERCYINLR